MKVLLAIDWSQASQVVVKEAAARPWPAGTEFRVIHVLDLAGLGRVPGLIQAEKQNAEGLVKAAADDLARAGHSASSDVVLNFPRLGVREYAQDWGADFLMVGSHGHNALTRFLVGSVAQAALRSAPCSVEIVRAQPQHVPISAGPMKILLATDGSHFSIAAAKSIAGRPWPQKSEVKIVSVAQLLVLENQMSATPSSSTYPHSLLEEIWSEARRRARDAAEDARRILSVPDAGLALSVATPVGDPRVVLLDHAGAWGADIIVLGSHGWRGMDRLLMGSVSENIALHAKCSVEIIRVRT